MKFKCQRIQVLMKQIDEYVSNALSTEKDKWIKILANMKGALQRLYNQIGNHSQYDLEVLKIIGFTQDNNDSSGLENIVSDFRRKYHIWEDGSMNNWDWLSNFLDQIVPFVEGIVSPFQPFTNIESQVFNNKENRISRINQIMDKVDASNDIQTLQQQQAYDQQTINDLKKQLDTQTQNAKSLEKARNYIIRLKADNRKLYNQWLEEQREKEIYQQEKRRLEDEKEDLEKEHKDLFWKPDTLKNELDSANLKYNESEQLLQEKALELQSLQNEFNRVWKVFESFQSEKAEDINGKEQEITNSRQRIQKIQRENNEIETQELIHSLEKKASQRIKVMDPQNGAILNYEEIFFFSTSHTVRDLKVLKQTFKNNQMLVTIPVSTQQRCINFGLILFVYF